MGSRIYTGFRETGTVRKGQTGTVRKSQTGTVRKGQTLLIFAVLVKMRILTCTECCNEVS